MDYIHNSFERLKIYCERENFKGWDPYDALNSRLFINSPFKKLKLSRLFWIQLFKNSPINLRTLFLTPKEYNPKGLALFLSGYANLYRVSKNPAYKDKIDYLADILVSLKSKKYNKFCWGYNFDWQSRVFFIPRFTPNIIVSTFAGNALLDAYEITKKDRFLNVSKSICDFILKDLNRTYNKDGNFSFSYSPLDRSVIFNVSLLASRFLSRVYHFTQEEHLIAEAKRSVAFSVKHQNSDGSWFYGIAPNQKWIDNFHTAYNLEALYDYRVYSGDNTYNSNFEKGVKYFLSNFFTRDGMPKYYSDYIYPIDIHSAAQLIVFLLKTGLADKEKNLLDKVLAWTINNMQDNKGYFYYQVKRFQRLKIPYIRWANAWMFYALSLYLCHAEDI